ncbi:hypothetical protein GE21DRAFT_6875 [Neurospora crassa]|uniref:Uncharacterized protein n=2 Tax=Neurospora crassa TaxID=5141 RepID=Q1K684_NEUCR|nr:hypothetical protein NCU07780 [Neurospora crassa OR74A]EAA29465.1 hypothetical protein NCU07780 [Neurospora crassa OR74A]KHE85057.1 hypothetical protein GE21DRAFT_6875 [Neurospora crassa]CAC28579.2 hypothetical protein [Neurospora crassa]|eukprot:XP_958701.1 hypothetical protein NCU07780 [Neurospora crassa OR74A]
MVPQERNVVRKGLADLNCFTHLSTPGLLRVLSSPTCTYIYLMGHRFFLVAAVPAASNEPRQPHLRLKYDIQEIVLALQAAAGISTINVTRTIQDVIQYAERVSTPDPAPNSPSTSSLSRTRRVKVNKFRTKRARGTQEPINQGQMGAFARYRPDLLKGHWNGCHHPKREWCKKTSCPGSE